MVSILFVGIGAGLVSALLFAVVATGSPLALTLSFVAPLPILIAALGWNHRSGLVAAAAGGLAIAAAFSPGGGIAFAAGWGLPAWWLSYLALLGRPGADGSMEWYPLGRLLLWVAAVAALITIAGVIWLGGGDYDAYQALMQKNFESFLRVQGQIPEGTPLPPVGGVDSSDIITTVVDLMPFLVASSFATILTLNLWLGAKIVAVSERLPRPWPYIPGTAMPLAALVALTIAIGLSFLSGLVGALGAAVAGALTVAFAFQGLGLIHATSQGRAGRFALLLATYFLLVFVSQIAWPILALTGVADSLFGLRRRLGTGSAGPRSTGNPST